MTKNVTAQLTGLHLQPIGIRIIRGLGCDLCPKRRSLCAAGRPTTGRRLFNLSEMLRDWESQLRGEFLDALMQGLLSLPMQAP